MAFNEDKYKEICMRELEINDSQTVIVAAYTYGKGEPKITLRTRFSKKNGDTVTGKFGGVPLDKVRELTTLLKEVHNEAKTGNAEDTKKVKKVSKEKKGEKGTKEKKHKTSFSKKKG